MEAAAIVPDARRWHALALVCVAFFMVVLDVAIVNVALPSIQADLEILRDTLQWIVTAYSLAFGGFLLLGGRAADLFGRRRVFMVGMTLDRVQPHADLTMLARLSQALARARAVPLAA